MDNRSEVKQFLTSRRARITPEQAGIDPVGSRRRVTGLRRDEVARLAGVSVDYYTRLERGHLGGVSDSVLDALARALGLDQAEHEHLWNLARAANNAPRSKAKSAASSVQPALQYLLDAITAAPALLVNNRMDLVAANALGFALYSDLYSGPARPGNFSRYIFLDARAYDFYPDWQRAADTNVAILRTEAGRSPHDRGISDLVGELSVRSDEFRTRWAAHNVRRHFSGRKTFRHSVVGLLELTYQSMDLQDDPGHRLTIYPAEPGSPSEEGLQLLASWGATEHLVDKATLTSRTR